MPIYLPPISRRQFLAGSLATAAGALLPQAMLAADRKVDPNRWVIVSDIHVGSKRDDTRSGTKPAETFAQAARQILALDPAPVGMIVSGDLAFLKGTADNYKLVRQLFKPIREAGIPMHLLLGNHDLRANFWAAFPEAKPARPVADRQAAVIETPLANWFLMDSLIKTDFTPGSLGQAQLDWLAKELDARQDKPALLVAHHNLEVLLDSAALMKIAEDRKQAKAYFFGHTHRWKVSQQKEIHLVNAPATAWLFDQKEPRGWLDIALSENGATVVLNALDKKHAKHGERVELKWRA